MGAAADRNPRGSYTSFLIRTRSGPTQTTGPPALDRLTPTSWLPRPTSCHAAAVRTHFAITRVRARAAKPILHADAGRALRELQMLRDTLQSVLRGYQFDA